MSVGLCQRGLSYAEPSSQPCSKVSQSQPGAYWKKSRSLHSESTQENRGFLRKFLFSQVIPLYNLSSITGVGVGDTSSE